MDGRGARHLMTRLAARARVGQRVEVVSAGTGAVVQVGEKGTLMSLDEGSVAVLLDCGREVAVDPFAVGLRPVQVGPDRSRVAGSGQFG